MGSRSKTDFAYIAGFLDGDGSLMMQIKKRVGKREKNRPRFMFTVCFYQDTRHEEPLFWIREILNIGYISRRNDGMTELRINGFKQIKDTLSLLLPYLKFKKKQAEAILKAVGLLTKSKMTELVIRELIESILLVQKENYVTRRKRTKEELLKVFGLTP